MLHAKLKNGSRELWVVGLFPRDLLQLIAGGPLVVEGADYGQGEVCIALLSGETHREILEALEKGMQIKFPRDAEGEFVPVMG